MCEIIPEIVSLSIPGMGTTITLDRLNKRGYVSPPEIYSKIGLPSIKGTGSIKFPHNLTNRPVRDPYAGWCERCSGGLNGSPAIYSIGGSYSFQNLYFNSP
jgi:hypothetical protein